MVFEMTMPSVEQRQGMLAQYGQGFLSPEALARFAKSEHLAPAIIQRVSRVMTPISDALTSEERDATFEQLVNQTLALQGHDPIEKLDAKKQILPTTYNPKYLNASIDMQTISEALKSYGSARLCLYGPPGTGKTAYGHYLSTQCDKPLHLKKASDLLSMYVGGTEANMAKAFKTATEEGAILMIDEVDSFISDRNNAVRSWEVTAINEMLTQMEAFDGVFIASTNRMDGLDPAALRRFDLKVKVDYLAYEQRLGLFSDTCAQMGFTTNESINDDLIILTNLMPGDFAAISRQSKFRPIKSAQDLYDRLSEECSLKGGAKGKNIGFL
jgi:SpoVK/Ycf46/Vps4 family AAA+-type ATPase